MKGQGIRFFARTTNIQSLEGPAPIKAVVGEFPSPEAAVAAYHSKEHQEALIKLDGGAERELFILEALE